MDEFDVEEVGGTKRYKTSILPSRYYNKWNKMSFEELKAEKEGLIDKLALIDDPKIGMQLLEVQKLLDSYMAQKFKGAEDSN